MARARARKPGSKKSRTVRRKRKTPTNLSLRTDLVERAKAAGLNLSEVVDGLLETAVVEAERSRWLEENQEAIEGYNAFIRKHGVFGDGRRLF